VELQVRSRSGLALKHQVVVSNSPGTIDPGFRGELKVLLTNHGMEDFLVNEGDRIAQAIAAPYFGVNWVQEELSDSSRGEGGLGSTGVK
jgi:dUTP pyrophosphatase